MASRVCVRRLQKELILFNRSKDPDIRVATEGDTLHVWHFVLNGVADSPYAGGQYWGRINFPETYPVQPPSVYFFTPNGRFETGKRLCLHGVSDYHGEDWDPKTTILGLLQSIRFAMRDEEIGIGSITASDMQRRELARNSIVYNQRDSTYMELFSERKNVAGAATSTSSASARAVPAVASFSISKFNEPKLKAIIKFMGLSYEDCKSKDDLVARAKQAQAAIAVQKGPGWAQSSAPRPMQSTLIESSPQHESPDLCVPVGSTPGLIVNSAKIINHIELAIDQKDLASLGDIVSKYPLAVHAIRLDGKTPAVLAGLAKNAAALVFLVERGAAFRHHGPEPHFMGHHVNALLRCEDELNRLAQLAKCRDCAQYEWKRWKLIEMIFRHLGNSKRDGLSSLRDSRPIANTLVVCAKYLLVEMRMSSCTTLQKILRMRIMIDVMLTSDEEVRTFIDLNGATVLIDLMHELQRETDTVIRCHANSSPRENLNELQAKGDVGDTEWISKGLFLISRVALFICLAAVAEKRKGRPQRRNKLLEQGICNLLLNTLRCRLSLDHMDDSKPKSMERKWAQPPATNTVSFICQSLTEITFDACSARYFDTITCKGLITSLSVRYKSDRDCAEMLSWWTYNMILHGVFASIADKHLWSMGLASEFLEAHPGLDRAQNLLHADDSQRTAYARQLVCECDVEKLLKLIAADPVCIHRPDAVTGQTPLMVAANTGNICACDSMMVLIEHNVALKYHAIPPNRGRHHVDKFVPIAHKVDLLAKLAEVGYQEDAVVNPRYCPGGHELKKFLASEGFLCDSCGTSVPVGSTLHGCRDGVDGGYDECEACFSIFTAPLQERLKIRNDTVDWLRNSHPAPPLSHERLALFNKSIASHIGSCGPIPEDDTCFMCSERFGDIKDNELVILKNECGHVHHLPCLTQWLTGNRGTCPTCDKALSMAWGPRHKPPAAPLNPTTEGKKLLASAVEQLGCEDPHQLAALGARILADQALTSTRRARQVLACGAFPLMLRTCDLYVKVPEVLHNIGLVLLEVAISLKSLISVKTIGRDFIPILSKILNACIRAAERQSMTNAIWPVVMEVACQAATELALGPCFRHCHHMLSKYKFTHSVLRAIKMRLYYSRAELMRIVWILFSCMINAGGDMAATCTASCAGLLYWQIYQQELMPEPWLEPLKQVAGEHINSWAMDRDTTDAHISMNLS